MTIYEKIERAKKEFGYNNRILGEVVGKEEPAFGQSMRRKSLSALEIKELEKFLDKEQTEKNPQQNNDESLKDKMIEILERQLRRAESALDLANEEIARMKNK